MLKHVVEKLEKIKFITDTLSHGDTKFMVCKSSASSIQPEGLFTLSEGGMLQAKLRTRLGQEPNSVNSTIDKNVNRSSETYSSRV